MNILFVVYDNNAHTHEFPLGTAYLAAVLREAGHQVTIYHQDVNHYPEEHLTDFLNKNTFDVVGIGVIGGYYQYRKLLKISRAINLSSNRPKYFILGGHGPSPEPEYFLKKTDADIVVIGEGELTVVELLGVLSSSETSLDNVKGIAFRKGDNIQINQRRGLIEDLDSLVFPAYDLFPVEYYRLRRMTGSAPTDFMMPVLSARGCTFKCNFCYRMDKGYRPRSVESILEEVAFLQKDYNINFIYFSDELLMSSKERIYEFCEGIAGSKLQFKWYCNGRLNYATPDILKQMKNTGCVYVNYGIESFDDEALKKMNKALNTRQIVSGIEATLNAGLHPGFNIIWGNIGETKETLQKGVDFLLKYNDASEMRTIRPVTPYPGSPLYYYAIENGLLKDVEDFYEHKHLNSDLLAVNFTNLTDEEFHRFLMEANLTLIKDYYKKQLKATERCTRNLYLKKNTDFRGFRQT